MGQSVENKIATLFPNLQENIDSVGFHKVALRVLKEDGSDYGDPDKLDLPTAITVLGTKLAMIHRERANIINGLKQLQELKEMD